MHVYACCVSFSVFNLYAVCLTEGASVLLTASSPSGFQVEGRLLPDQLSVSVKDEDRKQLHVVQQMSERSRFFLKKRHKFITAFRKTTEH